ncbi:phage tail assembly chaperone [Microbulbifer sp. OS29]|uniref:Phage tail assembly chaperone n=1 Tax=Microbulbifer okhotskensis TaxID=2926617 RepID=A0A9X2J7Z6_9GAMM|nr:phage tail assembly chaperone [Microbulbifer okhotskensis]MCO1337109.1 phage tail assembly chaperone [Microbulbifer okhotskensis]
MGQPWVKLPLYTPEGKTTEHYLEILSVDSDAFQMAQSEMQRDLATANLEEDKAKRFELVREAKVAAAAALVTGWSLDDKFTVEAVKELLREAPQLVEQIDRAASNRALFFASGSKTSSSGPAVSSNSTRSRRGAKKVSANSSSKSKKQPV